MNLKGIFPHMQVVTHMQTKLFTLSHTLTHILRTSLHSNSCLSDSSSPHLCFEILTVVLEEMEKALEPKALEDLALSPLCHVRLSVPELL